MLTAGADKALAPLGLAAFSMAMTTGRLFGDRGRARWGDRLFAPMETRTEAVKVVDPVFIDPEGKRRDG